MTAGGVEEGADVDQVLVDGDLQDLDDESGLVVHFELIELDEEGEELGHGDLAIKTDVENQVGELEEGGLEVCGEVVGEQRLELVLQE